MESLSVKINDLYYGTVEREIAKFYDMGWPESSSIPPELVENSWHNYSLVCTKKIGEFSVRISSKQKDGTYQLFASVNGKLKNCG